MIKCQMFDVKGNVWTFDIERLTIDINNMLFFGKKKRLIDYASCAG